MARALNVVVLVGSLRTKSYSRLLAHSLEELAAPALSLKVAEIGDLPFYNEDREADAPAQWKRLREDVAGADAVLFITPEYNRSIPGVLKNAIDVLSRPYGQSTLVNKPAAIISLSQGALGGFGANHHLRQTLVFLNVHTMAAPEAYVGMVKSAFDEEGRLVNPDTRSFLGKFLAAFESWSRNFVR